jgi:tellurite resistance protein
LNWSDGQVRTSGALNPGNANVLESLDPAAIAAFVAAAATVVSLSNTRPTQAGIRRISFGIALCAASVGAVSFTKSTVWYGGLFLGGYPIYTGWGIISRRSRLEHERHQYVTATARVLSCIALSDGMISPKKAEIIRDTYAGAGFSADEVAEAEMTVRECEQSFVQNGSTPAHLFDPLKEACEQVARHSDNQTRFIVLRTALRIAASDGFVSSTEEKALRVATSCLGLPTSDIDAAWNDMFGTAGGRPRDAAALQNSGRPANQFDVGL